MIHQRLHPSPTTDNSETPQKCLAQGTMPRNPPHYRPLPSVSGHARQPGDEQASTHYDASSAAPPGTSPPCGTCRRTMQASAWAPSWPYQVRSPPTPPSQHNGSRVNTLPVASGLGTSMLLETVLLRFGRDRLAWPVAAKTAVGMSLISMLTMEAAENVVDYHLTGGAVTLDSPAFWAAAAGSMAAGFLAPLPYNYLRLRRYGKVCH